ncbi:MAG: TolC family protein [Myxococcota bacterium]
MGSVVFGTPFSSPAEEAGSVESTAATQTVAAAPQTLDLPDLLERAVDRNGQIRVSAAEVDEAKALYQAAQATAYPQLNIMSIFAGPTAEAKTRVQNDITTVTDASLGGDLNFGQLGVTFRGNVTLAQPLFTFGKVGNAKKAARHLVTASRHKVDLTSAEVVYNVHRAYWSLQLVRGFLKSLREGQETLADILVKIEELQEADSVQVTENDRLRLVYALSTLGVREAQAEAGGEQAEQALRLLVDLDAETPVDFKQRNLGDAVPDNAPPLALQLESAKSARPDLLALREVVEAQRDFIQLQRSGLWPNIFVGAIMNFAVQTNATDQTNPFIFDPYNDFNVGAGLGFQYELNLAAGLAEVQRAKAQLETRLRQERLATDAIELEVRNIHTQLEGGLQQLGKLYRANSAARGWLASSVLAYDIGAGDARELIDAFLAFAASEGELLTVQFDSIVRLADLARASGRLLDLNADLGQP